MQRAWQHPLACADGFPARSNTAWEGARSNFETLQAEADGVVAHLREQQRALAAREREAAARDKAAALRCSRGAPAWHIALFDAQQQHPIVAHY